MASCDGRCDYIHIETGQYVVNVRHSVQHSVEYPVEQHEQLSSIGFYLIEFTGKVPLSDSKHDRLSDGRNDRRSVSEHNRLSDNRNDRLSDSKHDRLSSSKGGERGGGGDPKDWG